MGLTLRLLVFRPAAAETTLDVTLRDRVVPELLEHVGIRGAYVGRRSVGDDARRVVASVWDREPPESGIETSLLGPSSGHEEPLTDAHLDVLPLAMTITSGRRSEPQILRVFRGVVRPGELEAYVEEARVGTLSDLAMSGGPLALHLGTQAPGRFVTVSAWTGWDQIELATGGNIHQPMATRNAGRILSGEANHYEIIASGTRRAAAREDRPS